MRQYAVRFPELKDGTLQDLYALRDDYERGIELSEVEDDPGHPALEPVLEEAAEALADVLVEGGDLEVEHRPELLRVRSGDLQVGAGHGHGDLLGGTLHHQRDRGAGGAADQRPDRVQPRGRVGTEAAHRLAADRDEDVAIAQSGVIGGLVLEHVLDRHHRGRRAGGTERGPVAARLEGDADAAVAAAAEVALEVGVLVGGVEGGEPVVVLRAQRLDEAVLRPLRAHGGGDVADHVLLLDDVPGAADARGVDPVVAEVGEDGVDQPGGAAGGEVVHRQAGEVAAGDHDQHRQQGGQGARAVARVGRWRHRGPAHRRRRHARARALRTGRYAARWGRRDHGRYCRGLRGTSLKRISKWRWGPVELPLLPS